MAEGDRRIQIIISADGSIAIEGIGKVQNKLGEMERSSGSLTERLKRNWVEMTAGVTAAYLALQKISRWAEEAAKIDESLETLNSLTAQYDTTALGLVSVIQEASHGLIGMGVAAEVANDALMKGFTPDQIRQIASWAATLSHAKAGSMSAAEAFRTLEETMATGRERGAVRLLGTTIDLASAYGKQAEMMSKAEKQQAIFNLAQERMSKIQATINDDFNSAADRMERFNNSLSQAKYFFGELILVVAGPFMAVFNVALTLIYGVAGAVSTVASGIAKVTDEIGLTEKQAEVWGKRADRMYEVAARQGKQALDNAKMVLDAFKSMDKAHGTPLSRAGGDGENQKQMEKLKELVKKYADERELIATAELDRELVKLNQWFEEQREKLRELGAADKEYSELVITYAERRHQAITAWATKTSEFYLKVQMENAKENDSIEKERSAALFRERERSVKERIAIENIYAQMYGETESDMIRRKAEGEREILAIQQEGLVASITEQTTWQETLKIMEKYRDLENEIAASKRMERAETDRANLKGDADRQIRLINEGLGRQKLLVEEAGAKVGAYERLWMYAHTTMTGYMASLYDSGLRMFQGLEEAVTQFAITGKMRFRDFANSVIADLMRIAVRASIVAPLAQGLFGLFGGGGGGGAAISLGGGYGFSGLPPTYFPTRGGGGDVVPGITYLVGERGRELFIPSIPGTITPTERAGEKEVKVQIINESGTKMQVTDSRARFNAQEMIVTLWLDAAENNKFGLGYALGRG
ncbi:MAG TPA: phage tail tape measure C-terminal domain-containing protein [Bacteroidota bacterium]|nr:phage tail tape measure C-terminal domain-containing protein [Bacteroidota bacterium]